MIRALVVDDEAPARGRLKSLLAEHEDVSVVGEASDGDEAVRLVADLRPDLVFLDIQMPGRSGVEVLTALPPPRPRVIFCTAFDRYAIEAFDLHALDYLMKPLSRERLSRAMERVRRSAPTDRGLESEVAQASRTQARLLPQTLPVMTTLDYAGCCRAARDVAGDYYDFLSVAAGRLGIAVADVSGKGLYAGLLMAGLQARVQTLAPLHGVSVDRLALEVNRLMHASTDSNRYASLFYAHYDDRARTLTYVNAGHNPPLLLRAGGRLERLEANGTVIGLMPDAGYHRDAVTLRPGDVLVIYTDGVTEGRSSRGEELGEAGLEALVRRHVELPAAQMRDRLMADIDAFRGGAAMDDDMTLVVARGR